MSRRTGVIASLTVLALIVGVLLVLTHRGPGADSANGTGFNYEGRFYWASGKTVDESSLGGPVAKAVQFQDTTTDLRAITGFAPEVTLAALLPSLDGSPGGLRWTLVSVDMDRGVNPAAFDDTRAVLDSTP